jgi:hypothetical protein
MANLAMNIDIHVLKKSSAWPILAIQLQANHQFNAISNPSDVPIIKPDQ